MINISEQWINSQMAKFQTFMLQKVSELILYLLHTENHSSKYYFL